MCVRAQTPALGIAIRVETSEKEKAGERSKKYKLLIRLTVKRISSQSQASWDSRQPKGASDNQLQQKYLLLAFGSGVTLAVMHRS